MERTIWAEIPLEDDINLPQFNRKKIVTGYNVPGLEDRHLVEITIKEIHIIKENGKIYSEKTLPNINIYDDEALSFKNSILSGEKTVNIALTDVLNQYESTINIR